MTNDERRATNDEQRMTTNDERRPRIISGGQTGVDRAALDVALEFGLEAGGWCPRGRRAEDGVIAARYPLEETPSADYAQRTEWNIRDSAATLILYRSTLTGGTALTGRLAEKYGRPLKLVDLEAPATPLETRLWIATWKVSILNVAGPRESQSPGIFQQARGYLKQVLKAPEQGDSGPFPQEL